MAAMPDTPDAHRSFFEIGTLYFTGSHKGCLTTYSGCPDNLSLQ